MMQPLSHRKAHLQDLDKIISLLEDDILGQTRETKEGSSINTSYLEAFHLIDSDPNQYLMVVEHPDFGLIATCHLTLLPSLTFTGSLRLQIEAVRVDINLQSKGIGRWMINQAIEYGKDKGAKIIQLTSNKVRIEAIEFYQSLGFESSHEGMKLYI